MTATGKGARTGGDAFSLAPLNTLALAAALGLCALPTGGVGGEGAGEGWLIPALALGGGAGEGTFEGLFLWGLAAGGYAFALWLVVGLSRFGSWTGVGADFRLEAPSMAGFTWSMLALGAAAAGFRTPALLEVAPPVLVVAIQLRGFPDGCALARRLGRGV